MNTYEMSGGRQFEYYEMSGAIMNPYVTSGANMNTYEMSGANMNTYEMSGANIAGEERSSNWYPVHAPAYTYNLIKKQYNFLTQTKRNKNLYKRCWV